MLQLPKFRLPLLFGGLPLMCKLQGHLNLQPKHLVLSVLQPQEEISRYDTIFRTVGYLHVRLQIRENLAIGQQPYEAVKHQV